MGDSSVVYITGELHKLSFGATTVSDHKHHFLTSPAAPSNLSVRPGCAGSWQTGRMGERGGSQSGSPAARQQSANEKRAVARNTAQRHLCQRHQQEMRLQHHVIVRRLSRQGTELRHVVSELTKQQSMIRHDDGSEDDPDTAGEDEERGGQGASEGTEPVINPYPVTFPSGAGHKKLCRQSAVGETSQVMYNSHVKLRRQPSIPRHTAAPGLHHPHVPGLLTRHRQTSPHTSPTRHQYTRSASPVKDWVQQHATSLHLTATSGTFGSPSAVLHHPERYNTPGTTARSTLATDTSHSKPPAATVDTQPAAASRRHSCAGLPQVSAKEATVGRSVPALQPGSRSRSDNALNLHTAVGNTHPSTTSAPVHGGQSSTQRDPLHKRRSTTPAGAGRARSSHRHSLQSLLPGGQPTRQTRGRRAPRRYSLQETLSTISINGDQC